jgi:hypothetical protein
MKKFTDEQIIKALECWMSITPNKKCDECPKFNEDVECSVKLHRHALGLINRQKAEIERLLQKLQQAKSEALMHAFSKFAGHSDYHGDTILCQLTCMAEGKETKSAIPIDMNQIKSKAIKKFAERLKRTSIDLEIGDDKKFKMTVVSTVAIDNLVKEMTEEKSDV